MGKGKTTHNSYRTPLYKKWGSMKSRVSPLWKGRKDYFDRGIKVCEEWREFLPFKEWALNNGYKEELELDRIDNDKGYSPDNCRFVTSREQKLNTTKTIFIHRNDKDIPLVLLLDELKVPKEIRGAITQRIRNGWDYMLAIETPLLRKGHGVKKKVIDTFNGKVFDSLTEAAEYIQTDKAVLCRKLKGSIHNNTSLRYLKDENERLNKEE